MNRHSHTDRILIVGGGFAGLHAARRLGRRLSVTLIDPKANFDFLPNIHEIVSGVKSKSAVRIPFSKVLPQYGHQFHQGRVVAIDPHRKQVRTAAGRDLAYDILILGTGSRVARLDTPGVVEHALPLHSSLQARVIAKRLQELDGDKGEFRVTIVGGGYIGLECLGEILRRYRGNRRLSINVVESDKRLLKAMPKRVHRRVKNILDDFDVELLTRQRVAEVTKAQVILESGQRLQSDATIWTAGMMPSSLLAESGLAADGHCASVRRTLQSRDYEDIFIIGDAADTGKSISKQAYHATDMGKLVAKNVQRLIDGDKLKKFSPRREQFLITFGYLSCFYVLDDLVIESPSLASARELLFQQGMLEFESIRKSRGQQRAWQRLMDFALTQSLDVARTLIPLPLPRDWYDLPRLPRLGR